MKKIIISVVVLLMLFYAMNKESGNDKPIVEAYPWQITILPDGHSRIFGITLESTTLKEVDAILKKQPEVALFETDNKLSLEAYYKNVSLAGMIGSFIISLEAPDKQMNKIKSESAKQKPAGNKGKRYELDKLASENAKKLVVKNLIYIPTVQLDEEIIVKRFGKPTHKIKLKTKETGWHYLYPEKGLDLIYKEEGKEILQYVLPKKFNALLEPLQSR